VNETSIVCISEAMSSFRLFIALSSLNRIDYFTDSPTSKEFNLGVVTGVTLSATLLHVDVGLCRVMLRVWPDCTQLAGDWGRLELALCLNVLLPPVQQRRSEPG